MGHRLNRQPHADDVRDEGKAVSSLCHHHHDHDEAEEE